ncbi:MAG: intradiol ring-cleavage dioxygenase [Gammaproteobacteria bacterium]|nr:intradiol ring-cleavage dioxygenase [Gammaproteobacteria bacterium]
MAVGLVGGIMPLRLAVALTPTPPQPSGPFYPATLPLDDDNDLTRVAGSPQPAEGLSTDLDGRLLDAGGNPIGGARIEIWQCDARGRYHHPRDRGKSTPDPNFQGHGHTLTDAQGRYRFRTIHPVPYPGRTPHIHAAVFLQGRQVLVTQIYVEGEAGNEADFLYRRIPDDKRSLVTAKFAPGSPGQARYRAGFDVVLGQTPDQT